MRLNIEVKIIVQLNDNVWKKAMAMFPFLTSFEFTELGYGVAFAIRNG